MNLGDDGKAGAQVLEADLGDVESVDDDSTSPSFDEAEEAERERRLSAPCSTI